TADAVEALGNGHRVFDAVIGQSVDGARQAFDALSGEVHASAAGTALSGTLRMQDLLLTRMRALQAPVAGQVQVAYAADGPGAAPRVDMLAVPSFDPRRFSLWGEGFGSWGRAASNGGAAGMDTSTGGFAIGAETRLDKTFTFGMSGGFSRTTFEVDGRLSSGSNETTFGAIYGMAQWGAVSLRAGASYAWHDIDTIRTITFPSFADQASASYDGSTLMAFSEVGYAVDLGWVTVEPFVGASVMRLRLDGFAEEGGEAALTGSARSYDLASTTLGVRAQARISAELPLTLRGMVGWRHAFGDVEPAALLAFSGGTTGFSVAGLPIDRNALVAEAGLDWQINKDMALGVSYSGQIGARTQEHAVKGNFT
ncbi:autotransporter outer membrane beta-barrel domain-containing protein, partial [Microvirga makkahensis]